MAYNYFVENLMLVGDEKLKKKTNRGLMMGIVGDQDLGGYSFEKMKSVGGGYSPSPLLGELAKAFPKGDKIFKRD